MNKPSKYTAPRNHARRAPMSQARAQYLYQTAVARMATGSECQECFSFGAHKSWCEKVQ